MAAPTQAYEVRYRVAGTDQPWKVERFGPNSTTITLKGLRRGQAYDGEARSLGPGGLASLWVPVTFTVPGSSLAPLAPTSLTAQSVADGVALRWAVSDAQRSDVEYIVEKGAFSTGPWVEATRVRALQWTDPVVDEVVSWYRVRAISFLGQPSAYSNSVNENGVSVGLISQNALGALAAASAAQDTADGKIELVYGGVQPNPALYKLGDYWQRDTDNRWHRHNGTAWIEADDVRVPEAITAAAGAQATADGKVKTFFIDAGQVMPTASAIGDLTYNRTNGEMSRWDGATWALVGKHEPSGNGANLLPNASFKSNTLGVAHGVKAALNQQISDGWFVRDGSSIPLNAGNFYVQRLEGTGIRCYVGNPTLLNGQVAAAQVATVNKIDVEETAKYVFGFSRSPAYNGSSPPAGVTVASRVILQFFGANDVQIGGSYILTLGRGGADTIKGEATAPTGARWCRFYFDTLAQNQSGATWTHDSTVALYTDFKSVWMTRKLDLDAYVDDGAVYGRYSVEDRFYDGNKYRVGLRVKGSSHRIGDQRNLPQSNTTAYGSVRSTTALTASSTGAVSVNAHTVRYGGTSVAYSAVPNAVTGLAVGSTYVIYCLDDAYSGGTRTWFAGTNPDAVMQLGDGVVVAGQVTIPSSGSTGGGGGGGGTGDWCVDWETVLPDGRLVRDLETGDLVPCWNGEDPPAVDLVPLRAIAFGEEGSFTLVSESGRITQSASTPMDTRDGRIVRTGQMLGEDVLVSRGLRWEPVLQVIPAGVRRVVKLDLGDRMFFAGAEAATAIATHNTTVKP